MFESMIASIGIFGVLLLFGSFILNIMIIIRFFEMSSHIKNLNKIINIYYQKDFAGKIKEDKLTADRIKSPLPENYLCIYCSKKVGLDNSEREDKVFICPYCNKENNLN